MNKEEFKSIVYTEISGLVKAMSNPHRLEILDLLANGEKTVESIANETDTSVANASQHLQTLKKARLLKSRRSKNFIYYGHQNQYVSAVWKTIREFARLQIPEINKTVESFRLESGSNSISYADLDNYSPFVLVDVRPANEYEHRHLEGAVNIPVSQLTSRLDQLPANENIIAYCRGPFCTYADQAVEILNNSGFRTYRLEEGMMDLAK